MSDLARLAGIETPAYVYDLDLVRQACADLRHALPERGELFYSLKANPHPAIVSALRESGCQAEVCSPGELETALNAGFAAGQMLYTGPGKRGQDLADAVKAGVEWFSVDSPYGLDQLHAVARDQSAELKAIIRVNDTEPVPGQGLTMTGVASQFGADADWIRADPSRFASRETVRVAGFHLYTGSNLTDGDALLAQFRQSAATALDLAAACGIEIELLDLGGGFGAPFARAGQRPSLPGLAGRIGDLLDETFTSWPRVAFESGRYLTAECGTLLTKVLDVKRSHGKQVLVLESGINHLGGMSGLRRLPPIVPDLVTTSASDSAVDTPGLVTQTIVAGPLCTPLDTWARSAAVAAVEPGDVVAVPNVGAYGLCASLIAFLGHPMPVEVVIDGGQVTGVSRLGLHRTDAGPVLEPRRM